MATAISFDTLPLRRGLLMFLPELAFAQHAAISGSVPAGTVWLNANESPEGPAPAARQAILDAASEAGRYGHRALASSQEILARFAGCPPSEFLLGNGSSEVLHCALEAFTSPARPLITSWPTWEMMAQIAEKSGRAVIKVPLAPRTWQADVERMAAEAHKQKEGALVHLGNPNNPTSSLTPGGAITWLAENLPGNTPLVVDEAYMDYVPPSEAASALALVRQGKSVIVTRTFSKLFGLAGARIGFAVAPEPLLRVMQPFRENVPSILGVRAAVASAMLGNALVETRRRDRLAVRRSFCAWLDRHGVEYIPPAANFVLFRVPAPVSELIPKLLAQGVAVGRRFDTLDSWMRTAIGTQTEMEKAQAALTRVLGLRKRTA